MKLTYSEQLKHPNWQKIRLQALAAADFSCSICGDTETTLHVHHKQYIKGRMAWEYESSNFEVLCEGCHTATHEAKDSISNTLASIPSLFWPGASDLLIGWSVQFSNLAANKPEDPRTAEIGMLASIIDRVMRAGEITALRETLDAWREFDGDFDFKLAKRPRLDDNDIGL